MQTAKGKSRNLKCRRSNGGLRTHTKTGRVSADKPPSANLVDLPNLGQGAAKAVDAKRLDWKICGACRNQFRHQIANAKPCTENPNW